MLTASHSERPSGGAECVRWGQILLKKGHGGNYCVFAGDQMVLLKASGALEKAHIVSVTCNDESSFHVMNIIGTEVHFF